MTTKEETALAESEVALADAERELSAALDREAEALAKYDRSGKDADLDALQKAKLRRERLGRLRDRAAEHVEAARKALRAAERATDLARYRELRQGLTEEAFARRVLPVLEKIVGIDRMLAKLIDEQLRPIVRELREQHDEARELAERIGDGDAFARAVQAHELDDARFLGALLVAQARRAESRSTPCEAFLEPEEQPAWNDAEQYHRAVALLGEIGAINNETESDHVQ